MSAVNAQTSDLFQQFYELKQAYSYAFNLFSGAEYKVIDQAKKKYLGTDSVRAHKAPDYDDLPETEKSKTSRVDHYFKSGFDKDAVKEETEVALVIMAVLTARDILSSGTEIEDESYKQMLCEWTNLGIYNEKLQNPALAKSILTTFPGGKITETKIQLAQIPFPYK